MCISVLINYRNSTGGRSYLPPVDVHFNNFMAVLDLK